MNERVLNISGIILTRVNRSTRGKPCSRATLSNRNGLGLNRGYGVRERERGRRLTALSHGSQYLSQIHEILLW